MFEDEDRESIQITNIRVIVMVENYRRVRSRLEGMDLGVEEALVLYLKESLPRATRHLRKEHVLRAFFDD